MALKAVVEKLDEVPEAQRGLYVETDVGGAKKFVLGVEPVNGYALEDVNGLKTALGSERTARERLEKQVGKFKDLDPDKARADQAQLAELLLLDPKKEADKLAQTKVESVTRQLTEKHGTELKAATERAGLLTSTVQTILIDSVAISALAEAGGSIEVLLPHVRAQTRVKENEGETDPRKRFAVEVVDASGNVRIADAAGKPMDLKGLVAEMKANKIFAPNFKGSGASGSGKEPGTGAGGPGQLKRSQMSLADKAKYEREHGQTAFLQLPP